MTTCISDQASEELSLEALQCINGGWLAPLAAGAMLGGFFVFAADLVLEHTTGKGVSEHTSDAVGTAMDYWSGGGNSVAPTDDGKGCTDRDIPF